MSLTDLFPSFPNETIWKSENFHFLYLNCSWFTFSFLCPMLCLIRSFMTRKCSQKSKDCSGILISSNMRSSLYDHIMIPSYHPAASIEISYRSKVANSHNAVSLYITDISIYACMFEKNLEAALAGYTSSEWVSQSVTDVSLQLLGQLKIHFERKNTFQRKTRLK